MSKSSRRRSCCVRWFTGLRPARRTERAVGTEETQTSTRRAPGGKQKAHALRSPLAQARSTWSARTAPKQQTTTSTDASHQDHPRFFDYTNRRCSSRPQMILARPIKHDCRDISGVRFHNGDSSGDYQRFKVNQSTALRHPLSIADATLYLAPIHDTSSAKPPPSHTRSDTCCRKLRIA